MNDNNATVEKHQVHFSYVWLGSLRAIAFVVLMVIVGSIGSIPDIMRGLEYADAGTVALIIGLIIAAIVVVFVFVIVVHLWAYKHLWYELGDREISVYSGIFSKKQVHVPYQRVQSVDQRASLLQRVFGVCNVAIDTAGGASNKAVLIPYLTKSQAEILRAELYYRKQQQLMGERGGQAAIASPQPYPGALQGEGVSPYPQAYPQTGNITDEVSQVWQDVGGVFAGGLVDTGVVTYEHSLTTKELIFTGLSFNGSFVMLLLTVLSIIGTVAASFSMDRLLDVGGFVLAFSVVGMFVFIWVVSILSTIITYGGFKARRRDNRIEVEHGLLQHQFRGVAIDRVQSIKISQSFIKRLLGYCEISIGTIDATIGGGGENNNQVQRGVVVHPFARIEYADTIIRGLLPEFNGLPEQPIPVAPVALRRAIIRRGIWQGTGFWIAVFFAIIHITLAVLNATLPYDYDLRTMLEVFCPIAIIVYVLCILICAVEIINAVQWAKTSFFAYNSDYIQIHNGGLSRSTVTFPRKKIQFIFTRSNPLQRLAQTATLNVRTAAGIGGTTVRLIDTNADDAEAILRWIEPRVSAAVPDPRNVIAAV